MKNILLKGLFVSASVIFATSSVSAMTCTNLTKSLSKGSENSEVLKLQQFLFDGGYLTVKPNGYFGNGTVAAVKKFQIANGTSPVGSVGPATRSKIKEVSCKAESVGSGTQPALQVKNNASLPQVKVPTTCIGKFCVVDNLLSCTKFTTSSSEEVQGTFSKEEKFNRAVSVEITGESEGVCFSKIVHTITSPRSDKKVVMESLCSTRVASLKEMRGLDKGSVYNSISKIGSIHNAESYILNTKSKEEIQAREEKLQSFAKSKNQKNQPFDCTLSYKFE